MRFVAVILVGLMTAATGFASERKIDNVTRKFVDTHACEIKYQDKRFLISKADLDESEKLARKEIYSSFVFGKIAAFLSAGDLDGDRYLSLAVYKGTNFFSLVRANLFSPGFSCDTSANRLGAAKVKVESGKVDLTITGTDNVDVRLICE